MELDNIIYPGFNKSLSELNAISKIKKKSCEIVDLTEIEWVRDVLRHRVEEVGTYDIKFRKPTDEEIKSVSEIVGADINIDELKNNFHKNKRIIGITSGKGGVGKSTITSLLGIAFDELGKKVGIMDSDIWGYSVPKILGAKFPPIPFNERIFTSRINNLNVISMDYFVKQDEAVIWRGPMLHKAIEQFLYEVLWQDIDILLIDSSSTDNSLINVEEDERISIYKINQSDFQHGKTRNLAVALSKGEYVAFLTQDAIPSHKYWLKNILKPLIIALKNRISHNQPSMIL